MDAQADQGPVTPARPVLDYAGPAMPVESEDPFEVGALAMGLCFFVPFVTGLMAILLGVAAIRFGRVRGHRFVLATIAVALGAVNIGGWLLVTFECIDLGRW